MPSAAEAAVTKGTVSEAGRWRPVTSCWCPISKPAICWPSSPPSWPLLPSAAGIVLGARVPIILTTAAPTPCARASPVARLPCALLSACAHGDRQDARGDLSVQPFLCTGDARVSVTHPTILGHVNAGSSSVKVSVYAVPECGARQQLHINPVLGAHGQIGRHRRLALFAWI
ncbi:hypothetical protein ACU4GD_44965 [Cupriavidus basilensis]